MRAKRLDCGTGTAGWIAVCAVAFLPLPTRGNVIDAQWNNSTDFRYEIVHMPDLDQGRVPDPPTAWGLPGNGGQYCVPTSTMNMIMYIAKHGHPQLAPGPNNWQDPSTYNEASVNLVVLGMKMGTGATTGTTGNGWLSGTRAWFKSSDYDHFVIQHYHVNWAWSPTQATITQAAINGSLVAFAYGRYEIVGEEIGLPLVERRNGHIVTLAKSVASSATDTYDIWVRDPADSPADTVQSAFGNRHLTVDNQFVASCSGICIPRKMSALNYDPENERIAYIDEYLTITPKSGYGFKNLVDVHKLIIVKPYLVEGSGGVHLVEHTFGTDILDAVSAPDQSYYAVLTEGALSPDPELRLLNPVTGDSEVLVEVAGATDLVVDPNFNLYMLADGQLVKLEKFGDDYDFTDTVLLANPGQALAYIDPDPNRDDAPIDPPPVLVVLSITDAKVMFFTNDLGEEPTVFDLPPEIPLAGEGAIAVPPPEPGVSAGIPEVWMLSEESDDLYGVVFDSTRGSVVEVIDLPEIQQPTAIDFDDAGHMFVSTPDGLVELARDAAGEWQVVEDSDFAVFDVCSNFHMVRSRTNFDPATMTGPGFFNIDPAELEFGPLVADCPDTNDPFDSDRDGVPDSCDPCPYDNPDDSDGDGVCDSDDACPDFDDTTCDDGNGCTIDSCDPCVNDAAAADGNDCVHDTGRLGVCESGVCVEVCPDGPYEDFTPLDYVAFAVCVTGPGVEATEAGCVCSDFDLDGDVDLSDFALAQTFFGGL